MVLAALRPREQLPRIEILGPSLLSSQAPPSSCEPFTKPSYNNNYPRRKERAASFQLPSASNAGYVRDVTDQRSGDVAEATLREYVSGQKVFGRYTLIKILGRGGMGIVWLARDEELEREVALKFLPDPVIQDRALLNDLKRETRRSLELTHKNIVRIYDFVNDARSACISM